jgi:hypothetical protein
VGQRYLIILRLITIFSLSSLLLTTTINIAQKFHKKMDLTQDGAAKMLSDFN